MDRRPAARRRIGRRPIRMASAHKLGNPARCWRGFVCRHQRRKGRGAGGCQPAEHAQVHGARGCEEPAADQLCHVASAATQTWHSENRGCVMKLTELSVTELAELIREASTELASRMSEPEVRRVKAERPVVTLREPPEDDKEFVLRVKSVVLDG